MTVFPVYFKVGITLPHRHSEFISESSSFENAYKRTFLSHNPRDKSQGQETIEFPYPTIHAINREAMKQPSIYISIQNPGNQP